MEVNKKIALAKEASKFITAHVSNIWPGFTPIPFIIYDDVSQVAVGAKWPERYTRYEDGIWVAYGHDPELFANTVIGYHGIPVAIWDTRTWPDSPKISHVAGSIAHEMFHSFQHAFKCPGPNDLILPQYPHSKHSVSLVIEENQLLTQIVANPSFARECIEKIIALRKQREMEIGADFMEYDTGCESYEGTSAYVEIKMEALVEGITAFEAVTRSVYAPFIKESGEILNRYRARCYVSGLILCLALDAIWPKWQASWQESGKTIYDWIKDNLTLTESEVTASPANLKTAHELLIAYENEKEQKINDFLNQPLTSFEDDVKVTLFDPMNLVCANNRCLHKHGKIKLGEKEQMVTEPFLVEYGDNILDVKRILIPNAAIE